MELVSLLVFLGDTGHNKAPKTVPDYEVPVLQELHGANNIQELDREKADEVPSAEQAYEQLKNRYSTKDGANALAEVYGSFGKFVRESGLESDDGEETPTPAAEKVKKTSKKK